MSPIFVRSHGPLDWKAFLAEPERQWARGYSARTLACCWDSAEGFPPEVACTLEQHPALAGSEPLLIFPEWKVPLPGGSRPSQNDIWVLARAQEHLVSIAVEGKVNEPFDVTVGEWRANPSRGRGRRLAFLLDVLGLEEPFPDTIRYQLIHRTASAVIEAERFNASRAVMLVHTFSPENRWFEDFAAFASFFGANAEIGRLATSTARNGLSLHLGWVHGEEKWLGS